MHQQVYIDAKDDKFEIACPMWANELVKNLPSRRWSKSKRRWIVPILRLTIEGVERLMKMEGVVATENARAAVLRQQTKQAESKKPSGGFPAWYPFKNKLKRLDGSGVDEYPPYKHAVKALHKKWGKNAFGLHHDMGTAKTRTEIDYACALRMEGKIDGMLVLVKLSGRRNWKEQFCGPMTIGKVEYAEGWAPIPADVYLPDTDHKRAFEQWLATPHDFKVLVVGLESLSQGQMPKLVERFLLRAGRVFAVIDESHLIANPKAGRTEWCFKFRPLCEYRDTATGTPISDGPLNLYAQFEWLDPDIIGIGDFYAFRNRYAVIIQTKTKGGQKFPKLIGYQNIEELTKTIAPYVDEVRKEEVLELPPKNYLPHVYLQLTKEQAALYKQIRDEGAYSITEGAEERVLANVLELELRLHQVAQGFIPEYESQVYMGRDEHGAKVEKLRNVAHWHAIVPLKRNPKLTELVDICARSRQFIIWASYRPALAAIVERLADEYPTERIVQIHGDIKEADRATFRNLYQKGGAKFMVGNEQTGGTSDTWTACSTMIYYDNTTKLIDRLQSEDRAHRSGLTHSVDYIDFVMEKTVDITRIKAIMAKMDLAEYIRRNIRDAARLLDGG